MHSSRIVVAFVSIAALATAAGEAHAEDEILPLEKPTPEDSQELGATVGLSTGGRASPGGFTVEGRYLYRVSELDWIESNGVFVIGGGGAECYRNRSSELRCAHGAFQGVAVEAMAGVRRYFTGEEKFRPFARLGLGLRLLSFSEDEVNGVAIPIVIGGGIRTTLARNISLVVDGTLRAGPSFLNRGLGLEPNASLSLGAGVEFTID